MKYFLLLFGFLQFSVLLSAQDWTQLADIPGAGRFWSAAFTINNKIYTGTGVTGFSGDATQDMWEYDPTSDTWAQVADYPAGVREGADGFGDGNRGFLAFGTSFIQFTNNVYEYLPASNIWEAKASCPASFAYSHGFTLDGKYYIGPENGNNKMHAYDFDSDSWSEVAPFPGQDRRAQVAFAANGKGYIGLGMFVFGGVLGDFYAYDPIADAWSQKASLSPVSDQSCATSINNEGYVFNVGQNGKSIYKYNETSDEWEFLSSHPGDRIANGTFIGLNGAGYLVFGERTISGGNIPSQETWRYIPSNVSIDDINNISTFQLVSSQNKSLVFKSKSTQMTQLMVWTLDGKLILNTEQIFSSDNCSVVVDYTGMVVYQISNSQGQIKSGKCFIN
jgi:N-acetylneuraminic acid mutarotase